MDSMEWYPLPVADHQSSTQSPISSPATSQSVPTHQTWPHTPRQTPTAPDLTILTLTDSTNKSPTLTPPNITPPTNPTELDDLWKKFVTSVFITEQPTPLEQKIQATPICQCMCHQKDASTQKEAPPIRLDISTPKTSSASKNRSKSHSKTQFHNPKPMFSPGQQNKVTPSFTISPSLPVKSQTMEQVTLQEACMTLNKKFVANCRERQHNIKERRRRALLTRMDTKPYDSTPKSKPLVRFEPQPRPKMTYKEMYHQSKRYWEDLPEVKEKKILDKRKKDAATNRLRMKLYQKQVLARMRRLKTKYPKY